jgi:hypothetical protein
MEIETVIGRFREPPRRRRTIAGPGGCERPARDAGRAAADHDARWNLNLKRRTGSAVLDGSGGHGVWLAACAYLDDLRALSSWSDRLI